MALPTLGRVLQAVAAAALVTTGAVSLLGTWTSPAQVLAQEPSPERTVTVRQGTSMAIALSPDKRQVAIDLQGGLWIVPIVGGTATRVTDEYGDVRQPSWSPDGRTLAFQSYRDGTWRIWTVGADGRGLKPVTSGPFDDREPHWAPDGRRIAFSSDRSGNYDVWVLDLATSQVRQITTDAGNDYFPTWSPDGTEIAFVSTREQAPGVYAITPEGRERFIGTAPGTIGAPSWQPGGEVLFSSVPAGAATTGPTDETSLILGSRKVASGEDYFPFRAEWISADEFLYPADGQIKRRSLRRGPEAPVSFAATLTVRTPVYSRKRRDFDAVSPVAVRGLLRPVATADGARIAFAALGDIWTVARTGGRPVRVTDDVFVDTDPAWSPDGTRLAFASDRAGGFDIWVRDLSTGQDRRLTSLVDADMAPAWSPDGRWIAFESNQGYEQGELYIVPAEGGSPRRLHERTFGVGYPSWARDGRTVVTSAIVPYSSRFRESMNYYRTVPVDGGPAQVVVPDAHVPVGKRAGDGPAVSPDGRHIAFVSHDALYVLPVGPDARPVGPARLVTRELVDSISWADSTHILGIAIDRLALVDVETGTVAAIPLDFTWQRRAAEGRLVVHAGQLVDGVRPQARPDVDILIDRNRITDLVPHRDALHVGRVVDASGQSVMPGLIEGHGHTLKEHGGLFGRVHLAYGVTGFRNVGAVPYEALEDKEAIESGRRPGPRIFTTGYLLDGSRPYYPMASTAPTEAAVDLELERARRLDYDTFKTYVRLPDLLQRRAIQGAHRLGIPTSSHEIYPAALSGGDSVEHTAATSRRGYSTKQSLTGRAYEDVLQIVARSGMTITPTLGLGGFQAAAAANPSLLQDPRWRLLQPPWTEAVLRARQAGGGGPRPAVTESQRTVLALFEAGATLIAGVDSPLSPFATALHVELQDYVAAGLTPFQALQTATVNPARLLGVSADLGTLEPGKLADLVVVDGNPLVSIADTLNVRKVLRGGELFTVEELLETPERGTGTARNAAP